MSYPRCVIFLLVLCCVVPASQDLRAEGRATALGQAGWEAIRSGKLQDASRLFNEALSAGPPDATLYLGAGLSAHLQGQEDQASRYLREALRQDPKLIQASLLLGDIAYRRGDTDAAIRLYEAALALAPTHVQIQTQLERWRKEAALHQGFQQNLNAHFTVLFEGPAEQRLAGAALDMLEAAYWRIGTDLLAYPSDIVTVVLYTDEQFRDITRSPSWAGGAYDGKIRVPMRGSLSSPQQLEKVLAHEFTHALVHSLVPRGAPAWIDEGLAVVFEKGDMRWAEQTIRKADALIPLSKLQAGFLDLPSDQVPLAYAESGLAVQMLLDRAGPLTVTLLLKDLDAGQDFAAAFERRFLISFSAFQASWSEKLSAARSR
jgi:tetratricopeptide (TPR) repeat protein